jgi:hypothetical protein
LKNVRNAIARSIICLTPVAVVVAAFGASAAPILVDFESDPAPLNVPNSFTSSDSLEVHFSDTSGANLVVLEVDGSNALATFFDDDSGLLMEFDFVASALSVDFGNTALADLGDTAVLTVFLGGVEVDNTALALNLTNQIDQTISYQGVLFDSATFRYNLADGLTGLSLTEVVDNIEVTRAAAVIPEPTAGLVFGIGALLVGAVCGRRLPTEVELRAARD